MEELKLAKEGEQAPTAETKVLENTEEQRTKTGPVEAAVIQSRAVIRS